ncbi:V-type proton ATPase subunit G 3 isoform X2 [Athene noctua]|uniref:V-type proton ATPase subunit G 3 isoform X2 n=1 Tax=Athene noctua TaxID=126797 RepID=UPI003EB9E979
MTSQSQGIQQLLQAEKRAKDKLEEAKKRKGKRLKQQTTETIRKLTSSYHKNMESMMKKLLSMICDINPEVHPNFRHAV